MPMKISVLLSEKKREIAKTWFDLIVETYPQDTANFLKTQKNRFGNPVGHTISEGIEVVLEELSGEMDFARISKYLDNIIRIRAIQDFTPSQAVGFIFLLKKVIREELFNEIHANHLFDELLVIESKIDQLANISFDMYIACREKIYKLKANELRNRTSRILKMSNMFKEAEVEEKDTAGF
ncbi:MAG: RsbRD N-terminal domain-containing protein [Nitrospirae bacterium]|nr:RsbRD N-terminal domain-containing protein [Nitrospirota bacterium]